MAMLNELHIARLGVIEEASLQVGDGLTVATGETGAGKTLVLTALNLLSGARADSSLVRAGAANAVVDAVVTPPGGAPDWDVEPGAEVVVSRELPADGRSRARINGRLAPVQALADLLADHLEVHAQHEHVRLSRPEVQRRLVDRFAGELHAHLLATYREAHASLRDAEAQLATVEQDARERAREAAVLRHELAEIEAAELDPEVDERLDDAIELLANAEDFREAAVLVHGALADDGGAADAMALALGALRRLPGQDEAWVDARTRLEQALADVRDLASVVRDLGDDIDADPDRLGTLQARKREVTDLCRRFGPTVADVLATAAAARERLAVLEAGERDAAGLEARVEEARGAVRAAAQDVTRGRRAAGAALAEAVAGHLAELAMPHATFRVDVSPSGRGDGFGPDGADEVRFLLAANPGEPEAELARAASGGERSRVSLAIEVALADVHDARVLVFDEVDAGIGGATALAVGEKLARLARGRQVLCVTHLPQLAAFADAHFVVEKGLASGRTVTTVRRVSDEDRVAELSRMLSGDAAQDASREHARELLDLAVRSRSA